MKILINGNEWLADSQEIPQDGRKYYLFDAEEYSPKQRRTLESLMSEWFKSGRYNYDTLDQKQFREWVKRDYGEGYGKISYVNDKFGVTEVDSLNEIPEYAALDYANGNRGRIQKPIKSTLTYNKKQLSNIIDNVLNAMIGAGVDSKKFIDIITELNSEKL